MDIPLTWRKSSRSSPNGQQCVEVACVPGMRQIATRDSKQPTGPHLQFTHTEWCRFTEAIKTGQFDLD